MQVRFVQFFITLYRRYPWLFQNELLNKQFKKCFVNNDKEKVLHAVFFNKHLIFAVRRWYSQKIGKLTLVWIHWNAKYYLIFVPEFIIYSSHNDSKFLWIKKANFYSLSDYRFQIRKWVTLISYSKHNSLNTLNAFSNFCFMKQINAHK